MQDLCGPAFPLVSDERGLAPLLWPPNEAAIIAVAERLLAIRPGVARPDSVKLHA
jgi:hypothetical protein